MSSSPGPADPLPSALPPRLRNALSLLVEAWNYARVSGRDSWDFAVEISNLRALGLTTNDLRFLMSNNYVDHAVERTKPADKKRVFEPPGGPMLPERSCFVLTAAGAERARLLHLDTVPIDPVYDRELRELWLGSELVKRFKQLAPNQHLILSAFEEQRWPFHIANPLSAHDYRQDPKLRLNRTIYRLNRHQLKPLIHFRGDGTGTGLSWEPWGPEQKDR